MNNKEILEQLKENGFVYFVPENVWKAFEEGFLTYGGFSVTPYFTKTKTMADTSVRGIFYQNQPDKSLPEPVFRTDDTDKLLILPDKDILTGEENKRGNTGKSFYKYFLIDGVLVRVEKFNIQFLFSNSANSAVKKDGFKVEKLFTNKYGTTRFNVIGGKSSVISCPILIVTDKTALSEINALKQKVSNVLNDDNNRLMEVARLMEVV